MIGHESFNRFSGWLAGDLSPGQILGAGICLLSECVEFPWVNQLLCELLSHLLPGFWKEGGDWQAWGARDAPLPFLQEIPR